MKLVRIILLLNIISMINSNKELKKYPTKRWIKICQSSNITYWYRNKSFELSEYLKNNLDALYM